MGKVIICLILTLVFSFLSIQSFMSSDYVRLKRWLAYYQEYKAFDEAVRRGDSSSAELLEHLKTLYPGQVSNLEAHLKEKYGHMTDTAKEQQSFLSDTLDDTLHALTPSDTDADTIKKKPEPPTDSGRNTDKEKPLRQPSSQEVKSQTPAGSSADTGRSAKEVQDDK